MKAGLYSVQLIKIWCPYPIVMLATAGIQAFLLDSRQKHAGMTSRGNGHFLLQGFTQCSSEDEESFV
jgi:hypothetical protein